MGSLTGTLYEDRGLEKNSVEHKGSVTGLIGP
jgi:hypothetical protein